MSRILVVDDQQIPRATVAAMVTDAGHEARTASSGEEGIRMALEWLPDVIVLDVHMPGLDGFDTVERLKANPETAPIPVVFLTAEPPTDELIVRGLEKGAYDFIGKGCSKAELLARVGVMTRIKRASDELNAIARIADGLIRTLDPEELSRSFIRQARDVFRSDAALLVYAPGGSEGSIRAGEGIEPDDPLGSALEAALLGELDRLGEDAATLGLDAWSGPAGALVRRRGLAAAVVARVVNSSGSPTLLAMFARHSRFRRESDAPLLHLLARQAVIALDNALLHARTEAQARALEGQARALETAIEQRSRFFAAMSHELRTPINAVLGYNQLLADEVYGEVTERQRDALARMHDSAGHLLQLVNDVLDLSKIEAGKIEIQVEKVPLGTLIRRALGAVEVQAAEKGLRLELDCDEEVVVRSDPARLNQILLNLLSNAVKFTEEGSVRVTMSEAPADVPRAGGVELRVRDTGPGISADELDRIFQEFEQSAGASGRGTGLGLAISRKLATLLGGELTVESEPGRGSTFILRLPEEVPGTEPGGV
jgi:signal transduction histidine kinase